jgi:hypothetical protein
MGGRAEIFELLAGEDVDGDKMDLGVTVLASLGGGHFDDLTGTVLDHNEAVLAEGRALHRVGGRGAGVGALEGMLMLSTMLLACDFDVICRLLEDACANVQSGVESFKVGYVFYGRA